MQLSIFVARVLAVIYLSVGISVLSGKTNFGKMIEDFERSPGLTYLAGILTLILGMLLVHSHNIWVRNWTVLITVIGWGALLKGILLLAFPKSLSTFKGWYKNTRTWGTFIIALGFLFTYLGFILR